MDANKIKRMVSKYGGSHALIMITKHKASKLNDIDNNKFLVKRDLQISHLLITIRKRLKLKATSTLYLILKDRNIIPTLHTSVGEIYHKYKRDNGLLYMQYADEDVFG